MNPPLRVAIADDEAPARSALRRALEPLEGVELIGEAANGEDALALIEELAPELIFLDIKMPGLDGLQVADRLRRRGGPAVVFVTAFSSHAVEAFRVAAIDYILKPIDPEKVSEALRRIRTTGAPRLGEVLNAGEPSPPGGEAEASFLRVGGSWKRIDHRAVILVESAGNYVRLHGEAETWLVRAKMADILIKLGDEFLRVHRSYAARRGAITEVRRGVGTDPLLFLRDGRQVPVGRKYWSEIKHFLT